MTTALEVGGNTLIGQMKKLRLRLVKWLHNTAQSVHRWLRLNSDLTDVAHRYASLCSHGLPVICLKNIFLNIFLIATSQAGLLLTSHLTQCAKESKCSISDYYFLDITISQQPRALYYIKQKCTSLYQSISLTLLPWAAPSSVHLNVGQLHTCESFARGSRAVWHHHPLEVANRPANYRVLLLGVTECRTWFSDPTPTPGDAAETQWPQAGGSAIHSSSVNQRSQRGSPQATLGPWNVPLSTQRLSSKWN